MSVLNRIYFSVYVKLFLFIAAFVSLGQTLKPRDLICFKDVCKCNFPNGKVIDLSHHINVSSINVTGETNLTIIFHPCEDFKFGNDTPDNECFSGASICLRNLSNNKITRLGRGKQSEFHINDSTQEISVIYTEGTSQTTLNLKCVQGAQDSVVATKLPAQNKYVLTWTSSSNATCPVMSQDFGSLSGLSTGSMLVIMLIVFSMVYFGGGMLALKYLRGAEGKEMIPNYDFWMDLPYLVRDGILFTLGGFNTPTSYDRI